MSHFRMFAGLSSSFCSLLGIIVVILSLQGESAGATVSQGPLQEPRRVGSTILRNRLIHAVYPEYPEEALAARLQGVVVLEVTVNESGEVWESHLLRGHPLLNDVAVEAVRQWRFEPLAIEGQIVPVISVVRMTFQLVGEQGLVTSDPFALPLRIDEAGVVWSGDRRLEGTALLNFVQQKMHAGTKAVVLVPHPDTPRKLVENTLEMLQRAGIPNVRVAFSGIADNP